MMDEPLDHPVSEPIEIPDAVVRALKRIAELYTQSLPLNTVELSEELYENLCWGTESGSTEEELQKRRRRGALGWALHGLAAWTPQPNLASYRLQIFLTTLQLSLSSAREAMEAVPQETGSPQLVEGLVMLLKATNTDAASRRHRVGDQPRHEETLAAGRGGDYSRLGNLIRHLEIEVPPDVRLAVMLLIRFAPEALARHIEARRDVFFSVAVQNALAEDAPKFALSVNDVTFKFICVTQLANDRFADETKGSVDDICALLLQVAQTDFWRSWLLDFARYPHAGTVAEKALSEALPQLTAAHWSAFVDAVELWTHERTAEAVANILVPFLHTLGNEKSADMWRLAFERWNKWDYGCNEKSKHLFAPSACSFDFPVAMHYALIPLVEAEAEEARLHEGIATVEQKWFTDLSELLTYRNRLSSRLRLVQHGLAIRNPSSGGANPLPPSIEPDSEFAKVRYRFFDVIGARRRGK